MPQEESLEQFNNVSSIVFLSLTFLLELVVAYRTKLRLDWSMIIISIAFLLSYSIRIIAISLPGFAFVALLATSTSIIQVMIFFFIFEMVSVQLFIQSETKS